MATLITLCNQALAEIAKGQIASLDESSLEARECVRFAQPLLNEMIDWLVNNKGLTRQQAYALSSVAVDLRISNLVDTPNFAVSAILDLGVFERARSHHGDDD